MDWEKVLYTNVNEKPLDTLPQGISNTAVFRKIAFIGDSLSSGEFESRDKDGNNGYHDFYEYSWGQYIARKNGLTAYNFSRGGMSAKWFIDTFADEKDFWNKDLAAQAYVIALGVNDLNHIELGEVEDYKTKKETFARYYAEIIMRYKEIQPRAKFFFVTMPKSDNDDQNKKALAHRELLYKFSESFDSCYVIDLNEYGPTYDKKFKEHYYLYGHLNASGYILTANMIDSYIDYIVRHNPDDFRRVGFIGTDLY